MPRKGKKKKTQPAAESTSDVSGEKSQQALQQQQQEIPKQSLAQALPGPSQQKESKGSPPKASKSLQQQVTKDPLPQKSKSEQQVSQHQVPEQQVLQGVWAQRQHQVTQGPQQQSQQIGQQQQATWGSQQQARGLQQPQQQARGSQQSQQQARDSQQQAWGLQQPRQQAWGSQQPQQQAQSLQQPQQQARSSQQQAWGLQQPQQQAQGSQQPQQVRSSQQQTWGLQQPQQQAWGSQQPQQQAWGLQQQAQGSQQPQQVRGSQQQARGSQQLQQQAWGLQQPQQAATTTQQQQKTSSDHRQIQAVSSGMHQQRPSTSTFDMSKFGTIDPLHTEISEKAKMTSTQLTSYYDMIPKRQNPEKGGSIGMKIEVLTNMFKIIFDDKFVTNAVHYDITIKPYKEIIKDSSKESRALPKALCRNIFEQFRKKHFNNRYPAYDGKKNAYSANNLPIGDMADVFEHVNQNGRKNQYEIIIKKVAYIDLSWIKNLRPGAGSRAQTGTQVLDIIMRHAPESQFTNIGRSLYWNINERELLDPGLALGRGGFLSGILGWAPYLNVDVSHKGFTVKKKVLTYIAEVLQVDESRVTSRDIKYNDKIQNFLKGLKVTYEIPNSTRRTHRIKNLSQKTSNETFIMLIDGLDRHITIKRYFSEFKHYNIKRPDLPTLLVGHTSTGGDVLLPIELCTIIPNQPVGKLNEEQTTNMIRKTTTDAFTRKNRIEDAFKTIQVNNSPVMTNEFHLSVSKEMQKVPARVLPAPELKYQQQRKVQVKKGTWFLQPFITAKNLEKDSWTVVNLSGILNIEPMMHDFVKLLQKTAREVGMEIDQPSTPFKHLDKSEDVIKYFNEHKKFKLIIVIVSNRIHNITYGQVKKITEMEVGVLTQCIQLQTLRKLDPYKSIQTLKNILLKINSKLNGINHTFSTMPACLNVPCMLVGADVTHPSPDSKNIPSIAAVAASTDRTAFRYNIMLRLQQPKEEIILDLENIILSQLRIYMEEAKCLPKRIVYYRDGVSEGQLPQIMYYEVEAIKKAIAGFTHRGERGNIELTCVVVQKRHHVRLFPKSDDPRETDDRRNYNVKVGTIVDTTITHPDHIDFYLVSHASIQGTARPTKYRCIYNQSNFTEDQLEELTYYLCHIYARCARSVSYPAPTYYAHLGAYRGRTLMQETKDFNLSDLEREQRKFQIKMAASPMYFV